MCPSDHCVDISHLTIYLHMKEPLKDNSLIQAVQAVAGCNELMVRQTHGVQPTDLLKGFQRFKSLPVGLLLFSPVVHK